jgi:hypothetical protein
MENKDDEIVKKIKDLRSEYQVELADQDEEDMNFLDRINDLVRSIFNDSSLSVYTVFNQENLDKWKKRRFVRWFKNTVLGNVNKAFYLALLVTITGFLVSEALEFYTIDSVVDTKTYVKAILTEVCFIFLSGYRSDNKLQMAGASVLRVSIFCLMLFVITSKTFIDSQKNTSNTNVIAQQVILIEKQIDQKERDMEYYLKKDWPRNYSATRLEKEQLVEKLIALKEQQADGATEEVSELVRYKAYGKAFFRVILLFISVLVTRRIFSF